MYRCATGKPLTAGLIFLIAVLACFSAEANDKVELTLDKTSLVLPPGGSGKVQVSMKIEKGWHTYGIVPRYDEYGLGPQATEFYLGDSSKVVLGAIHPSEPRVKYDSAFFMEVEYYKERADFTLELKARPAAAQGKDTLPVLIYYQICDSVRCLPPFEDTLNVEITIGDVGGTGGGKSGSIWSYLWVAMLAGAGALLTPCVFPMIPITVSFFTKRAEKNPGRGLRDASVYSIGIMGTFTGVGLLLTLLFGATGIGDFAVDPWVNLFIAAIFIVFALNLFGAFEIQLPTGLMNKLNTASGEGKGIMAILLMGLTFSLTSFTCTVPFVGTAFISAAEGEWFYPILGMLGFSAVFAAPFFLLALFPSLMSSLPRAGGWMNNIKVVMGFLEIAAAMKFISNADLVWQWGVVSREFFLAIWIGCTILITFYVLGLFRFPHDSKVEHVGSVRAMFGLFFASLTFFLISGLNDKPLGELDAFVPPKNYYQLINGVGAAEAGTVSTAAPAGGGAAARPAVHIEEENWLSSYEEGLKVAAETGQPVFIDFTGFTCTNCRWMEVNRFPLPAVRERMDKMVKVRLFTDGRAPEYKSNKQFQLEEFGSIELPMYVLLTPEGEKIAHTTFVRDIDTFVSFLDRAL